MSSRGSRLEDALDSLLVHRTLRDFLYLRPSKVVGGLRKEICDLLIVLDGFGIPIQLKGQGSSNSRQGEQLRRWSMKHAFTAGNQTSGACRTLSTTTVESDHPTQGKVVFEPGTLVPLHGLAVVEYTGSAFKMDEGPKHQDPNGTPIHYC